MRATVPGFVEFKPAVFDNLYHSAMRSRDEKLKIKRENFIQAKVGKVRKKGLKFLGVTLRKEVFWDRASAEGCYVGDPEFVSLDWFESTPEQSDKRSGTYWKDKAETMIGMGKMSHKIQVDGDVVAYLMNYAVQQVDDDRV